MQSNEWEGDVEDLLDALENLSADPKDGETWGTRYQTASALHDAWQQERSRRVLAEEDAERWHRLFDEGATLTASKDASLAAASDRYARAVADADEVRGRLVAERDAARGNAETQRLIRRSVEKQLTAVRDEGMRNYDHAIEQRDAALADVARLRADLERSEKRADDAAEEYNQLVEAIEERLPRYVRDDGTGDEASPVEAVEYAGDEIGRLRADVAFSPRWAEARGTALEERGELVRLLRSFASALVDDVVCCSACLTPRHLEKHAPMCPIGRALAAPAAKGGA